MPAFAGIVSEVTSSRRTTSSSLPSWRPSSLLLSS